MKCPKCGNEKLVKNGKRANGDQIYGCRECHTYFDEGIGTLLDQYPVPVELKAMPSCVAVVPAAPLSTNRLLETASIPLELTSDINPLVSGLLRSTSTAPCGWLLNRRGNSSEDIRYCSRW